ncbi:hypothetical protein HY490_02325 [Candidatus Woesearchaeota archaeon]|nr:hypothetical protein [Candidatus Woesearchaeota archaeon]
MEQDGVVTNGMDQEGSYDEQARGIAGILVRCFDQLKYHEKCTVWGVARYWDNRISGFSDSVQENGLAGFIDLMLDLPGIQVPKWRASGEAYVSLVCATNARIINKIVLQLAPTDGLDEIISDQRLLREAGQSYLANTGREPLHFWEFLLTAQQGTHVTAYRPLFERLFLKFGEKGMETGVLELLEDYGPAISARNSQALETGNGLAPGLAELLPKEIQSVERLSRPQSDIGIYLGKIRVKSGTSGEIDWEKFVQQRDRIRRAEVALDWNTWARAQVYNAEAEKFWSLMKESPEEALRAYAVLRDGETNAEKREVYMQLLKEGALYGLFDRTPHFRKTMTIHTKQEEIP